jgi:dihydroorotate dehydrogenase (NAD+) catalytic subunit
VAFRTCDPANTLRMVWQCARAVKIPVIGLGGITKAEDAVEYFLAGASAVQVGTANFHDPEGDPARSGRAGEVS